MALTLIGTPDHNDEFDKIVTEHYKDAFLQQTRPLQEWAELVSQQAEENR